MFQSDKTCQIVTIAGAKRRVACLNAKSFYLQTKKLLTGQERQGEGFEPGTLVSYTQKKFSQPN